MFINVYRVFYFMLFFIVFSKFFFFLLFCIFLYIFSYPTLLCFYRLGYTLFIYNIHTSSTSWINYFLNYSVIVCRSSSSSITTCYLFGDLVLVFCLCVFFKFCLGLWRRKSNRQCNMFNIIIDIFFNIYVSNITITVISFVNFSLSQSARIRSLFRFQEHL